MRSSPAVCGPRSISDVSSAADCDGICSTRSKLCEKRATRPPLDSITRLRAFRLSIAACTSGSLASITGERLVF